MLFASARNREFRLASAVCGALTLIAFSIPIFFATQPAHAQTETVLYSFDGTSGFNPYASLIFDKKGNLYGTTNLGGAYDRGTVFELTPANEGWTETVLHSFGSNGTDGTHPYAGVIMDKKGNLYGTTLGGGAYGDGAVFELTPGNEGWTETILHSFDSNGTDGVNPSASLIFDKKGNLYGTTNSGGAYGDGTVFELTRTKEGWTETVLYNFPLSGAAGYWGCFGTGVLTSAGPCAGVIFDTAGDLYGTTNGGGAYGGGTVFELTPGKEGWTETILHSFDNNGTDGVNPSASLIFDKKGNLYGTTYLGGAYRGGTGFELTPSGTETILWNAASGANPYGGLVYRKGNLYGTTPFGGVYGYGTVFELTRTKEGWTETTLHSFFSNRIDGVFPYASLIFDKEGNLYGTTYGGGPDYAGTVFELVP